MADIAKLGIQVTSEGVPQATDGMNKMTVAASQAEAATNGLRQASGGATGAAFAAAKAYAQQGSAAAQSSKQIEMMQKAANNNSQIRSVAMQLSQVAQQTQATGNFMQALAIQLPDIGLGFGTIGIALGVVLGALLPLIPAGKLVSSGLREVADNLQLIAPYAVAAAAGLALLYAPQLLGGVVSLIALLGRLVAQLGMVATAFLIANPAALFIAGIAAVVAAIAIFRDEITRVLGFDVVEAAQKGANLVIGSFVAAFHDLEFVWKQFPNIIGAAAIGAANAAISAIQQMINAATGMLNGMIQSINETLGSLPGGFQIGQIGEVDFGTIKNPYADALSSAVGDRNKQIKDDLSTNWIGQISTGIQQGASKAAGSLKDLANWMDKVDTKAKKKGGKTEAEKYEDIVDGANRRISSLQAERDALGMTEEAALKLRYETDLLNQAQQRGITLTDAQKSQLSDLAGRMASLEFGTKKLREIMDFAKDTTKGFINDLRDGLRSGEGFWKSFGNAALGVLDRITDKLLDDVLDAVFQVSNAGGGGGGGGILGFLGGLFGGGKSQMSIASSGGIGLYASGTPAARPGVAWVGENGPELVRFKGGEEVIPNHRLQVPANQNAGKGNGDVNITIAPTFNAPNADEGAVAALRSDFNKFKAEVPSTIVDTVKTAQRRRIIN